MPLSNETKSDSKSSWKKRTNGRQKENLELAVNDLPFSLLKNTAIIRGIVLRFSVRTFKVVTRH